jgi:hypothetical protein
MVILGRGEFSQVKTEPRQHVWSGRTDHRVVARFFLRASGGVAWIISTTAMEGHSGVLALNWPSERIREKNF